jgi:hypothetical protein
MQITKHGIDTAAGPNDWFTANRPSHAAPVLKTTSKRRPMQRVFVL